ncbi:MAG: type II toxin-antitoxin system HipA family toxin [Verrucomicrobia bacterium]|nr:type II toxin-antitoxin system HipA family toxin [Verrucomicrobiota bacterium]
MANVFVNRRAVGTLTREDPVNRFVYAADVPASLAVSVLMPVDRTPYFAERAAVLHPAFDMNLPEGALREALQALFSKALPVFDDLALLEIVGRSLIGRLRFGASPDELDRVPPQNLRDLLASRGTEGLFADLLQRYARYSGVSGVQPKLLIRDDGSLGRSKFSPIPVGERVTAQGTTHIVKSFDAAKYPGLAANEFFCLKAARLAGLPVPPAEVAAGGHLLVIERFDRKPDGTYLAFEDGCALDGRLSREKYAGSYEQLAATLASVLRGPDGTAAELARFFRLLVMSVVVRNGDAHRKNFGVVYDDALGRTTLAPAFDIVTTAAYLPNDSLALTLDGTKRWPDAKRLVRFGVQRCQLTAAAAKAITAEVAAAVAQVSDELDLLADLDPQAKEIGDRMRTAWREGAAAVG